MRKQALTVMAAIAAVAICATSADAATTRYASSAGTGAKPCTSAASPCALTTAVAAAAPGDQVVLRAGTYQLAAGLGLNHVSLRGAAGQPRPRVVGSPTKPGPAISIEDGTLQHLTIVHGTGNFALTGEDVTRDSLIVEGGTGEGAMAITGPRRFATQQRSERRSPSTATTATSSWST